MTVVISGDSEVTDLLNRLPEEVFDEAKKSVGVAVLAAHAEVSTYSGGLRNRSGRLRRSILPSVVGTTLKTLVGTLSTDIDYAPIHEEGGTIKARKKYLRVPGGPYLNIPLDANKTPAGVMRQGAGKVFSTGGYIIRSKRGNYIVMSFNNRPMFVLKKSVTIPARLGMAKAAEDQVPTLLSGLSGLLDGLR